MRSANWTADPVCWSGRPPLPAIQRSLTALRPWILNWFVIPGCRGSMTSPRSCLFVSARWKSSTCGPPSRTNSGRSSRPWSTTRYVGLSPDCSCPTAASVSPRTRVPPVLFSGSVSTSAIWWRLALSANRESILVCLTNLVTKYPPMPPKLNRRRAMAVLSKIDEILAWEARHENERDTRFVELGKYLCEVRAGQYWRLEKLKSFDEFLERRFPESRRKAYYLMSIHEQLPPEVRRELKQVGWTKGLELAKLARQQGQRFESATWLHKARQMPKAEFQREVERELTGKDSEPSELIYFKVYKSQVLVIEQAIETAALMLGSDKSQIGRASWRERGEISEVAVSL